MDETIKKYCKESNDVMGLELVRQILKEARIDGFYNNFNDDVLHLSMESAAFSKLFKDTCKTSKNSCLNSHHTIPVEVAYNNKIVISSYTSDEYIINRLAKESLENRITKIDTDIERMKKEKSNLISQREKLNNEVISNAS